jgi:hypothetical protein
LCSLRLSGILMRAFVAGWAAAEAQGVGQTEVTLRTNSDTFDYYARWSYEALLQQQPHVKFEGLWQLDREYFVVCPELATATTMDGSDLQGWFDYSCKTAGSPVRIVAMPPHGATPVAERTASDRARRFGAPRPIRDVLIELSILLPPEFPEFTVDGLNPGAAIVTRRPLSPEEHECALRAYANLGDYLPIQFKVDPDRDLAAKKFRFKTQNGDIDLIPSRQLPREIGRTLRGLVEDDDDFWSTNRKEVLASTRTDTAFILTEEWQNRNRLACLVDAGVGQLENLRTYLSIYETVLIVAPLADYFEQTCANGGFTETEFVRLLETGRVKLLLPQALDRYPAKWLSAAAEHSPSSLLLSRRLASATILEARRRLPILYPPLNPRDRYCLLNTMISVMAKLVEPARSQDFVKFVGELGRSWSNADYFVHARGAMGTSHLGVGLIAGELYKSISGRDVRLELWHAAQKIEWATSLGAHTFPTIAHGYDETAACDMIAGLYSPSIGNLKRTRMLGAVSDILAIDNTVSIVDFAREFSSADIVRLRELLVRITSENLDEDFLKEAIHRFNTDVRHYERRPDLLKSVNVVGLIAAGAVAVNAVEPSVQRFVPMAGSILGILLNRLIDELPRHSVVGGQVVDFANSMLTGRTNPNAVLVARVRKEIARLKQ